MPPNVVHDPRHLLFVHPPPFSHLDATFTTVFFYRLRLPISLCCHLGSSCPATATSVIVIITSNSSGILIAGTSPSAPLLARLQQSHRLTVTNTPVTPFAPPSMYGRPIYNLPDSISPPLSFDTPNTTIFNARTTRSSSLEYIASSPLNRACPAFQWPIACPGSRATVLIHLIPSRTCRALFVGGCPSSMSTTSARGSMILHKLGANDVILLPPPLSRTILFGESLSSDSKYPSQMTAERNIMVYAYDPSKDDDTEDAMQHAREWKQMSLRPSH